MDRARAWYTDKLGLEPDEAHSNPAGTMFQCADGTSFLLFMSSGKSDGSFTQLGFAVDDVEKEAAELRARGVKFVDYDTSMFKTVDGLAELPDGSKGGWIQDPDGNLLTVVQAAAVPAGKS
jgi:catechol 2,3-dioxygenase-like lactoylglutathione lyase family enzyme